jgi:4-hydroxyphenylpyruvate dioxygenase
MLDTAKTLGAQHVLATARMGEGSVLVDQLRRAADTLGEIGVRLSVEFMATSPLQTLEQSVELLDIASWHGVGIVLDLWHLCLGDGNAEALRDLAADRIGFVQLADAPRQARGDNLDDSLHGRLLPGQGDLPLRELCQQVHRMGFSGVVSVEVLSRAWRHMPIDAFAAATLQAASAVWEDRTETRQDTPRRIAAGMSPQDERATT